ncbi:endonuclease [Pseudomonas luteola]|uniref:endonuclease n=1 Tax=Pseudomonas luteola TaxID=47886 RepID=UPI000F7864DC|nr:endonuclease [Pseudomonas luteola]RRW40257.1 deoxyribonuclease I [Pseudomonas luteola]
MRAALVLLALTFSGAVWAAPETYYDAKHFLRNDIYGDQNAGEKASGDLYCGCQWEWVGRSGGVMDHESCGYQTRALPDRAIRLEWEHIQSVWSFGHQLQCWREGGSGACRADPLFNRIDADLHNLAPAIGEANADRGSYLYGELPGTASRYGRCDLRIDPALRTVEPRDAVKGLIARTHFYMSDRYGITLSRLQQKLFMDWDKRFPVSRWEKERDSRIARVMGHHNPFVTGQASWTLDRKPGLAGVIKRDKTVKELFPDLQAASASNDVERKEIEPFDPTRTEGMVYASRRTGTYFIPTLCPSYHSIPARIRVAYRTEREAQSDGFRKDVECR